MATADYDHGENKMKIVLSMITTKIFISVNKIISEECLSFCMRHAVVTTESFTRWQHTCHGRSFCVKFFMLEVEEASGRVPADGGSGRGS